MTTLPEAIHALLNSPVGERFATDIRVWWQWRHRQEPFDLVRAFIFTYEKHGAFRSLVDYRLRVAGLPHWSGVNGRPHHLCITCPDIGGGFRIHHGYGTFVNASRIGKNFCVGHHVTIGDKDGTPIIGEDVIIKPGAVIYGPIHLGDRVIIGPNATVGVDVPQDTIAFAPRCVFVQKKETCLPSAPRTASF